jgi:hypothetical protein
MENMTSSPRRFRSGFSIAELTAENGHTGMPADEVHGGHAVVHGGHAATHVHGGRVA